MDLSTLAVNLRKQAQSNSALVLDDTVFLPPVLEDLRTAFALPAGAVLDRHGGEPAGIPDPANEVLTIAAGKASVLNQTGVGIGLTFTAPGGSVQALIAAAMGGSWKFSDSFTGLDLFPFHDLSVSSPRFVYATAAQDRFSWPGDPSSTISLAEGLNFLSEVTFANLPVIAATVGSLLGTDALKFYGPFKPTVGQRWPVGEIKAILKEGNFGVGVAPNDLSLSDPAVAVRVGTSDELNPVQEIDLLIVANFKVLEVAVAIPMSGRTLAISATPLPNQGSIKSLIESLPGGSGFTSYIPAELSAIFADVGLDRFGMIVDPTPKVTDLTLAISTHQPWTIIPPDVLVLEKLILQIEVVEPTGLNWTHVFIEAKAEFLPKIFTGRFDFTVGLERRPPGR